MPRAITPIYCASIFFSSLYSPHRKLLCIEVGDLVPQSGFKYHIVLLSGTEWDKIPDVGKVTKKGGECNELCW